MEIRIETPQFPLGASLNRYLRRRLTEELAVYGDAIREVKAYLSDTRTSYGGYCKQCRLVVCLMPGDEIAVQGIDVDLFVSIRSAADRLQRGLRRRLAARGDSRIPRRRWAVAEPIGPLRLGFAS